MTRGASSVSPPPAAMPPMIFLPCDSPWASINPPITIATVMREVARGPWNVDWRAAEVVVHGSLCANTLEPSQSQE